MKSCIKLEGMSMVSGIYGTVVRELALPRLLVIETAYHRNLRLPAHAHARGFLSFVLQGAYRETHNQRTEECSRGVMIWHPPEEVHADAFESIETRCLNIEPQHSLGLDLSRRMSSNSPLVSALAASLYREFRAPDVYSPLILDGLISEMLGHTLRAESTRERSPGWLRRVEARIRESFDQDVTVFDLAREACVHPVHLSRAFRRYYRCTAGEYLRRIRIEFACEQLRKTRSSIASIAQQCGFSDQSSFSKTFRRITGCTPAQFRRSA